jgi:hypothetical protein
MRLCLRLVVSVAIGVCLSAQVIEFESNGLRYKTLTKNSVTIMFAPLPSHVREYSIVQISVANGSKASWTVKPEDFTYQRDDGTIVEAAPALTVVNSLIEKATRHDVIKLVSTYEAGIYGNSRLQSTNGYEVRRRSALAEVASARLKAAAAASAIAFVKTKLNPGESTDGAVFFPNSGKALGPGKLRVHAAGENFEFKSEPELLAR